MRSCAMAGPAIPSVTTATVTRDFNINVVPPNMWLLESVGGTAGAVRSHVRATQLREMLGKEGAKLVERDKVYAIVKIYVAGTRN